MKAEIGDESEMKVGEGLAIWWDDGAHAGERTRGPGR